MVNIEIHGFSAQETETKYSQIERMLRDLPLAGGVTISKYGDVVLDLKGYHQPYIRLAFTDGPDIRQVIDLLKPFKLNVQLLRLYATIDHG